MADKLEKAKAAFDAAKSYNADLHSQIKEDLEFSNPANPMQWPDKIKEQRRLDGRPCHTFDYTNQYIMQVVNDQRMNKPGINVLPVGGGADKDVAEVLEGLFRHIEYASRAGIAYDTSIELAARVGLGWLRIVPEVADPETNEQEIRIKRVIDSRSIMLNPDATEPDGSDATEGHVEEVMSRDAFKRKYPKAKLYGEDGKGWYTTDDVRVCEYFEVVTTKTNYIVVMFEGERMSLTEDEYWKLAQQIGFKPDIEVTYLADQRTVEWTKYCADEVFEQTVFPSIYVPLVPVLGYESWIDGKRHLCGLTRRMMDGQQAYNVARTAEVELASMSPKQPWLVDSETVAAFKSEWANANTGGRAYLTYKARSSEGEPLPPPQRIAPAPVSQGYLQLAQASLGDIEASVGMYRANLGQTSNETSGKAINARQRQGSIANYHYVDNQARSIEQLFRIALTMLPSLIDVPRTMQIMREDGSTEAVKFDPSAESPKVKAAKQIIYNPNIGNYAIRMKVGPGYTTLRQESAEQLGQIMTNPALASVVGPFWAQMQDWPGADKLAKAFLAIAPPPVQEAYSEEKSEIPPEFKLKMQQKDQQLQQAQQMIEQLHGALAQAQQEEQSKIADSQMQAEQHDKEIRAKAATELAKIEARDREVDKNNAAKIEVAHINTDMQGQIANLSSMVQLILAHIQPPPALEQEVAEDLTDNEMSDT